MVKPYIKKSKKIYKELHSSLIEECFNRNASQQFNKGAVDAIKTINISINNLLDNDDLYKINSKDIKNTDPKNHNFYYEKILTKINEIYLEQHYYCSIEESAESCSIENSVDYCTIEELTEYDKGNTFIFFKANNYIKSCLTKGEEND